MTTRDLDLIFGTGDGAYGFPEKLHMFVKRLFQNPFLVAVLSESLGRVFQVHHGPDAVTLNAFRTEKSHVGCTRLHQRQSRDAVYFPIGGFESVISVGIHARRRGAGTLIAGLGHNLDAGSLITPRIKS